MTRGEETDRDHEITVTYENNFTAGVRIDHDAERMIATLKDQHGETVLELHDDALDLHQDFTFETRDATYTMSVLRGALTTLHTADRQEYLDRRGVRCPFCGSDDLHTGRYSTGHDGEVSQRVECLSCEAAWVDTYSLVGIRDETPPREDVTMLDSEGSAGAHDE